MRKRWKAAWSTGKLIFAAFLFWQAVRFNGQAEAVSDIAVVFLEPPFPDARLAGEICDREAEQESPASVCFWTESGEEGLTCRETGQRCDVTEIVVWGNADLVIQGGRALIWQKRGCFIDRSSAEELFGNGNASGQTVWYGGNAYTVCGTFESLKKIMVRQAERGDNKALDRLSLRFTGSGDRREERDQFLLRYGLAGDGIDFSVLEALVHDLILLFPAAAALLLAGRLAKVYGRPGRAAGVAVVIAALWFLGQQLEIPGEMIPSRWSDFDFWGRWWEAQKRNLLLLFESATGELQLNMMLSMFKSAICSLTALLLAGDKRLAQTVTE